MQRLARRMLATTEAYSALIQRSKNSSKVTSRPRDPARAMVLLSDPTLDIRQYLENLVRIAVDSGQQAEDISIEARKANRKARRSMAMVASFGALGLVVGIAGFTASRSANLRLAEVRDEVSTLQNIRQDIASLQQQRKAEEAALARQTTDQQGTREALRRQVADLQQQANLLRDQIAQRSPDTEPVPANATKQRQPEVETLQLAIPPASKEPVAERQQGGEAVAGLPQQASSLQDQITRPSRDLRLTRAAVTKQRQNLAASRSQTEGNPQDINPLQWQRNSVQATVPMQGPVASQQLLIARQSLATGRLDEARRLLTMAQMQMVFQPVERARRTTGEANVLATDVGTAIRLLDMGAHGQATRALDQAVQNAGGNFGR